MSRLLLQQENKKCMLLKDEGLFLFIFAIYLGLSAFNT